MDWHAWHRDYDDPSSRLSTRLRVVQEVTARLVELDPRNVEFARSLVCEWFERHGYERVWESDPQTGFGVGVHRLQAPSQPLRPGRRLFTFHGHKALV